MSVLSLKKLLVPLFLILALCISFPTSVFAEKPNYLANPGFEDGPVSSWQRKTEPTALSPVESILHSLSLFQNQLEIREETNPDLVYLGNKSIRVKASKQLGIVQDGEIDPAVYTFAHTNVLVKQGSVELVITDKKTGKEIKTPLVTAQPFWQSLDIPLPPGSTSATVTFGIISTDDSEFYVDNTVLHQVDFSPLILPEGSDDLHDLTLYYRGKPVNNPVPGSSVPHSSEAQTAISAENPKNFIKKLLSFLFSSVFAQTIVPTPAPSVYKTFPITMYLAVQVHQPPVDPTFATYFGQTKEDFPSILNNRISSLGLNRALSTLSIFSFDQNIPTNCTSGTYFSFTVNLPDALCLPRADLNSILTAISHGNHGGWAGWDGKFWATDSYGGQFTNHPDRIVLHELGHTLGFWAHYTDIWSATSQITNQTYYSPDYTTIMGTGALVPAAYSQHTKEMINRTDHLIPYQNNLNLNLPDQVRILDINGQPFFGKLTVYPSTFVDQHQPGIVSASVSYGPVTVMNGMFDYTGAGKPLMAQIKAEHLDGNPSAYVWFDSSRIQVPFWLNQSVTFTVPIVSDPSLQPTPTPTVTPTPVPPSGLPIIPLSPATITGGPSYPAVGRTDCCTPNYAVDNNLSTFWAGDSAQNIPGGKWELIYTHSKTIKAGGVIKIQYLVPYYPASARLSVSTDSINWILVGSIPTTGAEMPVSSDYNRFKIELFPVANTPPYITEIVVKGFEVGGVGPTSTPTTTPAVSPTPSPIPSPTSSELPLISLNQLTITGGPSYPSDGRTDCCEPKYAIDGNGSTFWAGNTSQNTRGGLWSLIYTHAKLIKSGAKFKLNYFATYYPASAKLFTSTDGINWQYISDIGTAGSEISINNDFSRFKVEFYPISATLPYVAEISIRGYESGSTNPTGTSTPPPPASPTPTSATRR